MTPKKYRVGDVFKIYGNYYMIAIVDADLYVLTNMQQGSRWSDTFRDLSARTAEAQLSLTGAIGEYVGRVADIQGVP